MKTVFISINRGLTARNVLKTDALKALKERTDVRMVYLVLDKAIEDFKKGFGDRDEIIPIKSPVTGRWRSRYLQVFARGLVWTESAKIISFVGKFSEKNRTALIYKIVFGTVGFLGRFRLPKNIFRWIERVIFPEKNFDSLFRSRTVDLLFVPDVQGKIDTALIKSARRFGVTSVAMTKGWDTICQRLLRALPDKLIVQSEPVRRDAAVYQLLPPERVFVAGFPQFDLYLRRDWQLPREEYCKKIGLDPSRAILFFGSSGAWTHHDARVAELLYYLISGSRLARPCSLILRPHFSNVKNRPYEKFRGLPNVFVNDNYTLSNFIDNWNPSDEDNKMLTNTLYHSALLIAYFSTLVLDAAMLDKPIINPVFGGQIDPAGNDVTQRLFERTHYQPIVGSGAVRLAHNPDELMAAVNDYLKDPSRDAPARAALRDRWCFGADGRAGERIGNFLLNELLRRKS